MNRPSVITTSSFTTNTPPSKPPKVNSFLSTYDLDPLMDGILPYCNALCVLSYEPQGHLRGSIEHRHEDGQDTEVWKRRKKKQDGEFPDSPVVPVSSAVLPAPDVGHREAVARVTRKPHSAPPVVPSKSNRYYRPTPPPTRYYRLHNRDTTDERVADLQKASPPTSPTRRYYRLDTTGSTGPAEQPRPPNYNRAA